MTKFWFGYILGILSTIMTISLLYSAIKWLAIIMFVLMIVLIITAYFKWKEMKEA
jgi:hypothetical protein